MNKERIFKAIETLAEESDVPMVTIINALTELVFDEEDAGELKQQVLFLE